MPNGRKGTIRDLIADVANVGRTLPTAVLNSAYGSLQRLKVEHAWQFTPVLTGFLRSRWQVKKTGLSSGALTNDAYYVYVANQTSTRPGYLQRINRRLPPLLLTEFQKIKAVRTSSGYAALYRSTAAFGALQAPTPPVFKPTFTRQLGTAKGPISVRMT